MKFSGGESAGLIGSGRPVPHAVSADHSIRTSKVVPWNGGIGVRVGRPMSGLVRRRVAGDVVAVADAGDAGLLADILGESP